jgi:hypothetical protein
MNKSADCELNMNRNKITNIPKPTNNLDAANKKYVDDRVGGQEIGLESNIYTLSSVGLIPHNLNHTNSAGFTCTASSELGTNHNAYKVLNPVNKSSWRVPNDKGHTISGGAEIINVATNFWIEISCPFEVRIYRFLIQPAEDTKLFLWKLQGKAEELWEDLPFKLEPLMDSTTRVFTLATPSEAKRYRCYRIFIEDAEGRNPGLNYWQLYALNPVLY